MGSQREELNLRFRSQAIKSTKHLAQRGILDKFDAERKINQTNGEKSEPAENAHWTLLLGFGHMKEPTSPELLLNVCG